MRGCFARARTSSSLLVSRYNIMEMIVKDRLRCCTAHARMPWSLAGWVGLANLNLQDINLSRQAALTMHVGQRCRYYTNRL